MDYSKVYLLQRQLELANMIINLSSGHMWEIYSREVIKEAIKMKVEIEKEIKREKAKLKG